MAITRLTVEVDGPEGLDAADLLQAVLDIGWETVWSRSGDPGWQDNYPQIPAVNKRGEWDREAVSFSIVKGGKS